MSARAIVTRADDYGSFRAANRGIAAALQGGVLRNVSVMVTAPYWREAVELARRRPDVCFGLHATVTSEWSAPRWSPVLGAQHVPELVRADGTFHATVNDLHGAGACLEQVRDEILAQIRLARGAGLPIRYLDEHMAFGWAHPPGQPDRRLGDVLRDLCRDEGLVYRIDGLGRLPHIHPGALANTRPALEQAEGAVLLVTHPAFADEEMMGLSLDWELLPPGRVAAGRFEDL
jgi:hypothetical protein